MKSVHVQFEFDRAARYRKKYYLRRHRASRPDLSRNIARLCVSKQRLVPFKNLVSRARPSIQPQKKRSKLSSTEYSPQGKHKVQFHVLPYIADQKLKARRLSRSRRAFIVYLQSPWYETLILELEFSSESELEPEKSRLWSLATLLNLLSKSDDEHQVTAELAKEGA